jgi:hypothetical protein
VSHKLLAEQLDDPAIYGFGFYVSPEAGILDNIVGHVAYCDNLYWVAVFVLDQPGKKR